MALAVAYDQAKTRQARHERNGRLSTGGLLNTPFFSFPNDPDMPHATLNQHDAGRYSSIHYHVRDQFQVIVNGKARFGRHEVTPYCVHFARAYTPYGPLHMDPRDGVAFFAMRAHRDAGAQRLPDKRQALKNVADRQPWQLTRRFEFATVPADREYVIQADPEMKDSMGLAAYSVNMNSNARAQAPDPSQTDGQYLVVLKGSLQHDGKEYNAPALVFVPPDENSFALNAGTTGMEGLILNFPRQSGRATKQSEVQKNIDAQAWHCDLCSFVYDEAKGMPEDGIAPGTRWEDIPDDWTCPDCSAPKQDFRRAE